MASEWFYQVMGEQVGPVSNAQLRNLAQRGTITIDTPIANALNGPWVPAGRVKGLFAIPPATASATAATRTIQTPSSNDASPEESSGLRTATKTMLFVCGGACILILVWFIAGRDTWELNNASRVSAKLDEAARLQQSDPLAAYKTYDELLKEAKQHKITDEPLAQKLAHAEESRTALYPKVQEKIQAEQAEKQRLAQDEARRVAGEKRHAEEGQRRLAAEEPRRIAEEKHRAEQKRRQDVIAATRKARDAATASNDEPYDLKGDRLGMSLQHFKAKYARKVEGHDESAPFCSDTRPEQSLVTLLSEAWHSKAGVVNCSITFPFEAFRGNAPTIADVKTTLLVHHFVDGKLYKITAWFPHDGYYMVKDGLIARHGSPKHQETRSYQNRLGATFSGELLLWGNGVSTIALTERFGDLDTSALVFEHRELGAVVAARTPKPTGDDL